MGYCARVTNYKFNIKAENTPYALEVLKELGNGSKDPRARGGSSTERWFSWMNDVDPKSWKSLPAAMEAWGWPVEVDGEDNVTGIESMHEKLGQEDIMFATIAPFIESGSFIELCGEDGARWRWVFEGGKFEELQAEVTWKKKK